MYIDLPRDLLHATANNINREKLLVRTSNALQMSLIPTTVRDIYDTSMARIIFTEMFPGRALSVTSDDVLKHCVNRYMLNSGW